MASVCTYCSPHRRAPNIYIYGSVNEMWIFLNKMHENIHLNERKSENDGIKWQKKKHPAKKVKR